MHRKLEHLHLIIDDDVRGVIAIQLHIDPTGARLDCLRATYDEIGGEAHSGRRQRTRHPLTPNALAAIEALLFASPAPTPEPAPTDARGPVITLTIGNGPAAIEYEWISHPPQEWVRLGEVVNILLSSVEITDTLFAG